MPGTEVAVQEGQVPALRPKDPSRTFTADDLAFPRLYIGQAISNAVQDGNAAAGDLYSAQDSDDPDPVILAKKGSEKGVNFYVLDLKKGKSRSIEGVLETWRYDDENAPRDAWTTYTYFIAIPSADPDIVYRWLLTRTGRPAAQKINTVLFRGVEEKPQYEFAFNVTTAERQGDKGRYFVARVKQIDATEKDLAVVRDLVPLVEQNQSKVDDAAGDQPAI